jgi:hypothetical protein
MTDIQPLKITLPPLQITLNDRQQVSLQWLPQSPVTESPQHPQPPEIPEPPPLPDGWKKWIAANKFLHKSDDALIECMVKNGIDVKLAVEEVTNLANQPYFQAAQEVLQKLEKLESILQIQNQLSALGSNYNSIPRIPFLSKDEFLDQYYSQNKPVILTGIMKNWEAMERWTPDYLKENYGNVSIQVQGNRDSDPNYEINLEQHRKTMLFGDYIDWVVRAGETNDYYMVANNNTLNREEMQGLFEDMEVFPEYLDPAQTVGKTFFWFGSAGTVTPLHHDTINIFLAQVSGRKLIKMISPEQTPFIYNNIGVFSPIDPANPDYNRYPLYRNVRSIDVILHPGEVIFLPVGWWHYVKGLEMSISVSFINFKFPNDYDWKNPSGVKSYQ